MLKVHRNPRVRFRSAGVIQLLSVSCHTFRPLTSNYVTWPGSSYPYPVCACDVLLARPDLIARPLTHFPTLTECRYNSICRHHLDVTFPSVTSQLHYTVSICFLLIILIPFPLRFGLPSCHIIPSAGISKQLSFSDVKVSVRHKPATWRARLPLISCLAKLALPEGRLPAV